MIIAENLFPDATFVGALSYGKTGDVTVLVNSTSGQMGLHATSDAGGYVQVNLPAAPLAGRTLEFHCFVWLAAGAAATMSGKDDTYCMIGTLNGSNWAYLAKLPALQDGSNFPSVSFTVPSGVSTLQFLFFSPKKNGLNTNWGLPFLGASEDWHALQKLNLRSVDGRNYPLFKQ